MSTNAGAPPSWACPLPLRHEEVQLAHGGGGRLMRELLEGLVLPAFRNPALEARTDAAVVEAQGLRLAFSTDTFVVTPRFFPGGNLGELAVFGTVNDLACAGAAPLALSCGLLIEEGYPLAELERILHHMQAAAQRCGVAITTGDTKVVDRGKGDGLYVNTAGLGLVRPGVDLRPARVRVGDAILVSGDVGRHGIAVMSVRHGIAFESAVTSDCAPIHALALGLLDAGLDVSCLRDPTRGGLGAVLHEIATDGHRRIEIEEAAVPVEEAVAAACELLGIDPLHVPCEGRLVVFVRGDQAAAALDRLQRTDGGGGAAIIGRVVGEGSGRVVLRTRLGTHRLLDLPSGEQLPRIC